MSVHSLAFRLGHNSCELRRTHAGKIHKGSVDSRQLSWIFHLVATHRGDGESKRNSRAPLVDEHQRQTARRSVLQLPEVQTHLAVVQYLQQENRQLSGGKLHHIFTPTQLNKKAAPRKPLGLQ